VDREDPETMCSTNNLATPHRWIVILRRKLRERGFSGAALEQKFQEVVTRVPGLFYQPQTLFGRVTGHDKLMYCVWRNPTQVEFVNLVHGSEGSRAILTEHDLYIWQSTQVSHRDFVEQTEVDGIHLQLRPNGIAVNLETVGSPSEFPWVFSNCGDLDVDDCRQIVEKWLHPNPRLTAIYPNGFSMDWYM
jgi:hypothetical protein